MRSIEPDQVQEMTMQKQVPATIADTGQVRIGGVAPSLGVRVVPANVADGSKVRLGGMVPAL
jgi:hypothetical protein